jgi:hypothetical protein
MSQCIVPFQPTYNTNISMKWNCVYICDVVISKVELGLFVYDPCMFIVRFGFAAPKYMADVQCIFICCMCSTIM